MGFVPLAFRAGSEKKSRVHIFWQKRIRAGDASTPWWFPSQTTGGSMRADRIVLPIPPGKRWDDGMPRILPAEPQVPKLAAPRPKKPTAAAAPPAPVALASLRFAPAKPPEPAAAEKPKPAKKPKAKNDPKLVAAAREFRDRYLEEVNAGRWLPQANAKYDVARITAPARGGGLLPAVAA